MENSMKKNKEKDIRVNKTNVDPDSKIFMIDYMSMSEWTMKDVNVENRPKGSIVELKSMENKWKVELNNKWKFRINKTNIDPSSKMFIMDYITEWKTQDLESPSTNSSELIRTGSKKIGQLRWENDPERNRVPFSRAEREYLYKWVTEYKKQTNNGRIKWKDLQTDMKNVFGKIRPRIDIKNIYNSMKRQFEREIRIDAPNEIVLSIPEDEVESEDEDEIEEMGYENNIERENYEFDPSISFQNNIVITSNPSTALHIMEPKYQPIFNDPYIEMKPF